MHFILNKIGIDEYDFRKYAAWDAGIVGLLFPLSRKTTLRLISLKVNEKSLIIKIMVRSYFSHQTTNIVATAYNIFLSIKFLYLLVMN